MQRASFFYDDKAIFGCHPTQESAEELENFGVRYFYDLTCHHESRITPYRTDFGYEKYPIIDREAPTDIVSFSSFIVSIADTIKSLELGEKIYVHCKGGHGRAGVTIACLLGYMDNLSAAQALRATTKYHDDRPEMTARMRKIGSPQTRVQKDFVKDFLRPLMFTGLESWLSMCDTSYPVVYKDVGYACAKDALQHHPGRLKVILKTLLDQHPALQDLLRETGLRPLVYISRQDSLLGDRGDGSGQNALGLIWTRLRDDLHRY